MRDDLPALCGSRTTLEKFSTDKTKFPADSREYKPLCWIVITSYNQYVVYHLRQVKRKLRSKKASFAFIGSL